MNRIYLWRHGDLRGRFPSQHDCFYCCHGDICMYTCHHAHAACGCYTKTKGKTRESDHRGDDEDLYRNRLNRRRGFRRRKSRDSQEWRRGDEFCRLKPSSLFLCNRRWLNIMYHNIWIYWQLVNWKNDSVTDGDFDDRNCSLLSGDGFCR